MKMYKEIYIDYDDALLSLRVDIKARTIPEDEIEDVRSRLRTLQRMLDNLEQEYKHS